MSAADIRRGNTLRVIRAIHSLYSPTRKTVAAECDLSFASVSSIVTALIASGVLVEAAILRRGNGRPTAELGLNSYNGLFLGVDLAETYVNVETFDSALGSLSHTKLSLDPRDNEALSVARRIRDAIEAERQRHRGPDLLAVGVSAPGQVDRQGGTSVFAHGWDWHNVPLLALLDDVVAAPLILDNPLKALSAAELWCGPGRNVDSFMVLNVGTGVGVGLGLNHNVFRGPTNSAGEWGHTVIVANGRRCRCGSLGCVETYIGAPGIMESLREIAPDSPLLFVDDQSATIAALSTALANGDATAKRVVLATAGYLGITIANMINANNPDLIVLTGWVIALLGDELLDAARPYIDAHALATPLAAVAIRLQGIPGNAVSLGAAILAMEHHLNHISAFPLPALQARPSPNAADRWRDLTIT